MMKRRRRLVVFMAAALLLAAAGGTVYWTIWSRWNGYPASGWFSDGEHKIELLTAGVGSVTYSTDSPLKEAARARFPNVIHRFFGPNSRTVLNGGFNIDGIESSSLLPVFRITDRAGVAARLVNLLSEIRFKEPTGFVFHTPFES